jgi:uncharacterized protein with HEPN domain
MKTTIDYLWDMLAYIARIEQSTEDGREIFVATTLIQDAVIRQYEVIGEIAKRLPLELLEAHPTIDWRAIKGFRDFLAHNYDRIDVAIIWDAIDKLPLLKNAVETMIHDLSTN